MRIILAFVAFLIIPSSMVLAQDADKVSNNAIPPAIVKPARDLVMLQFNYNNWVQKPDSVKSKALGYGFNAYLCYDFPIKKTKLSFAAGLGINTSVAFLSQQVISLADTGTLGTSARFLPDTAFSGQYKRYKFVTTYITAPFELRYFGNKYNRNKGFKAAIGMEIGTLLGAHTKALKSINGVNVKEKVDTKRYVTPWNFAATARIGWGNFSLFGSYNLTNVFKENAGPPITPMSVGICLTGL
jgi:outer membrane protein with beta-barrel domain